MQKNRKHDRFTRRLETEFSAGERIIRGISSNLSERGLFIRTNTPLNVGSTLEATLYLHDGRKSRISGIVRRAIRSNFNMVIKNGMGIELTACDDHFLSLLREHGSEGTEAPCCTEDVPPKDSVNYAESGQARTETPDAGDSAAPPAYEEPPQESPPQPEFLIIACAECGAKNKVRTEKLASMTPKCGRCKAPLVIP